MLHDAPGLDQTLSGAWYSAGQSMGADFAAMISQSSDADDSDTITGFRDLDADLLFPCTSLDSMQTDAAPKSVTFPTASLTDSSHGDTEGFDDDDHHDNTSLLSSQLTAVSQRAMRTARRLARSGSAPLMVSSPEVNEALEDTNTLISIFNDIMTIGRDDANTGNLSIADCGLAFSALACHQNLMTLFRAMCDVIHRRLQHKREQRQQRLAQQHQLDPLDSSLGPFSVAQFVMVLQLLMHLISRLGRTLATHGIGSSTGQDSLSTSVSALDYNMATDAIVPLRVLGASAVSGCSTDCTSACSGLLVHVQEIVGNIPIEHERLRLIIQELQTEMDHPELH